MSKDFSHKRRDVIAEEAARYLIELESSRADTRANLAAWLKTSPEHVEEFLAVASLWGALPDVSRQPSIEELVELAVRADTVVPLGSAGDTTSGVVVAPGGAESVSSGTSSRTLRHLGIGLAAAAILAAVVVGGALTLLPPPVNPNLYTTAIGEQTSLPLPDGSLVTLNTRSTVREAYSEEFRDVHLTRGEALFEVARDPERPFRVITEHAVIQAVGTQFNVRHQADDVTVTVVEGIVDVSATPPRSAPGGVARVPDDPAVDAPAVSPEPTRLTVGQQARIRSQSAQVAVVETTVETATAWRERRLVFESLSLGEVIDEFNRYNDPPLLIEDEALKAIPISGVFRANDRESFVASLKRMNLAQSQSRADGTIVLRGIERPRE